MTRSVYLGAYLKMESDLGIAGQLKSLAELLSLKGCSETFYDQLRSDLLTSLVVRPKTKWLACLPSLRQLPLFGVLLVFLGSILGGCLYSVKVWSFVAIIAASAAGGLGFLIIIVVLVRRDRLRKAKWTKSQRLAELERLRDLHLITAEEYAQMQTVLRNFA